MNTTHHLPLYVSVMTAEIALFYYVRRLALPSNGTSIAPIAGTLPIQLNAIIGQVLLAVLLWGSWLALEKAVGFVLPGEAQNVSRLLPQGTVESGFWIMLSVTAGIVEEFVFRGYLLRKFTALTKSSLAGVALQAAIFGIAHGYQGISACVRIACFGLLFGMVARSRKNLPACMMAHAWTDIAAGLLGM